MLRLLQWKGSFCLQSCVCFEFDEGAATTYFHSSFNQVTILTMIIQGMLMSVEPTVSLALAADMHSSFACCHDELSLIYFVYQAKTMIKWEYRSRAERTVN